MKVVGEQRMLDNIEAAPADVFGTYNSKCRDIKGAMRRLQMFDISMEACAWVSRC
jgi:hypothetical protein